MHTARLLAFMLLLALRAAAGPLDDLRLNFQTRRDFADADRDQQLKKLDASYLAALERQLEKIKATGKLDTVIPYFAEVQAVQAAKDPLPELPATAPAELKQMRAKHAEARTKILKSHAQAVSSLATKMEAVLKTQEAELTKAGRFEDALVAKKMREDLKKDEGILNARAVLTDSSNSASSSTWRSLLLEPMTIQKQSLWDICLLSSVGPDKKTLEPFVSHLKTLKEKPENILMCHSPSTIEFNLAKPVTELKGKLYLANPEGSVRVSIVAGNDKVFDHEIRKQSRSEPFELKFKATRKLVFEVVGIETTEHGWATLLKPEIR